MELNSSSQSVVFRDGALADVGAVLDSLRARRILFVVDPAAYSASAAANQIEDELDSRETIYFGEFEINPKIRDVKRGIQVFEECLPDVVIGFGGGTAIDLAKLIRGLASQRRDINDIISGKAAVKPNTTPLVAIPTTAGTGSEATHFAVVYRNGEKFSVAHPDLLPNFAILDPVLTYSMPKSITATTGLDALCQATESIWAVGATDESIEYASRSLRLSLANLERAVNSPCPEVRRTMCEAAHFAGKAINISKTTAPHALSYWLTTHYGISHGAAVAVFLGRVLEYNGRVSAADCNDPRGSQHVQSRIAKILSRLNVETFESGRRKLEELIVAIGCPASLCDIGIFDHSAIMELALQANADRLTNNPRRMSLAQLVELLHDSAQNRQLLPH